MLKLICKNAKPLQGNDVAPPLVVGQEYDVVQVHTENIRENGVVVRTVKHYDVGLISKFNYVTSHDTGRTLPNSKVGGVHWCHESRFEEVKNA